MSTGTLHEEEFLIDASKSPLEGTIPFVIFGVAVRIIFLILLLFHIYVTKFIKYIYFRKLDIIFAI